MCIKPSEPRSALSSAGGPSSSASAPAVTGAHDPALVRPKRKKITQHQLDRLTALFEVTDSPSFSQREEVGSMVQPTMTSREVQVSCDPRPRDGHKAGPQAQVRIPSPD